MIVLTAATLVMLFAGAMLSFACGGGGTSPEDRLLVTIPREHEATPFMLTDSGEVLVDRGVGMTWFPVWNGDASTVAYVARQDGTTFAVWNQRSGPRFESIDPPLLSSRDGKKVVYQARVRTNSQSGQGWVIVVDDRVSSEPFFSFPSIALSPDDARIAFVTGDVFGIGDRLPGHFEEVKGPVVFSADGASVAASVKLNGAWRICVGTSGNADGAVAGLQFAFRDKMQPLGDASRYRWFLQPAASEPGYEEIFVKSFSADGRSIAYAAKQANKWSVPVAGSKLSFDEIGEVVFNPRSAEVAYAGRDGTEWFLVRGEQKIGPYEAIGALAYSNDGSRLAFGARRRNRNATVTVLPGNEESPEFDGVGSLRFSPDGSKLAYVADVKGQQVVVVGDERSEGADAIDYPRLSADGSKITYGAVVGRQLWSRVMRMREQQGSRK
jgi:hypothetical protein